MGAGASDGLERFPRSEDARRAERLSTAAFRSFFGERTLELPGATLFRAPEAPATPMLNRVVGLGASKPATEEQLDAAIAAMDGLRFYVSVSADARPPELAGWLQSRGFERGWGWMQFCRGVEPVPEAPTRLELAEIGAERGDAFARIVCDAYGLPPEAEALAASATEREGWRCWLALADRDPAGAAALFVGQGAGYLGFAGTLPEHRGQGAQSALLAARIGRARELGCEAVYTETGEQLPDRPSRSYRNILRAGFHELRVVANWLSPA